MTLLAVRDLVVRFGAARVVDGLDLDLEAGEVLGLVGESGSGKSATARALAGVPAAGAGVSARAMRLGGRPVPVPAAGGHVPGTAMIFQDARAALNPLRPVGRQVADVIARHQALPGTGMRQAVLAALGQVRLRDAERRLGALPQDLSGGECQRVAIAAALASRPRLLIADEPTTGLDVTTQAAILDLIRDLTRGQGLGVLLITHDLALAARWCDRIMVIHAGQMAETAPVGALFRRPRHPYTRALIRSAPALAGTLADLQPLPGSAPDPGRTGDLPRCRFAGRCDRRMAACDRDGPVLVSGPGARQVRCRDPL